MKSVTRLTVYLCFIVSQAFSQTETVTSNTNSSVTPYQNEDGPMRSKTFRKGFPADQSDNTAPF
jgi:hypothetical protein